MKNKIEENKRVYYLDIIKAIAMFFVVYLHIIAYGGMQTINGNLGEYTILSILALCDPLFFFVNGALLFNKKFDLKEHIKKIIKILILIVFWCIISYIIIFFLKKGTVDILGSIKSVYNLVDDCNVFYARNNMFRA